MAAPFTPTLSPSLSLAVAFLAVLATLNSGGRVAAAAATWCVARSDASVPALQTALDYACGAGADCLPLQANGLCFLPNSIQAHASYAFNSYYQKKAMSPGSCDFSGTATVAQSDPSYGSCVYPSSLRASAELGFQHSHEAGLRCLFSSGDTRHLMCGGARLDRCQEASVYSHTAGGGAPTTTSTNSPTTTTTTTPGLGNDGTNGLTPGTPGLTPTIPDSTDDSRAASLMIPTLLTALALLFVISH